MSAKAQWQKRLLTELGELLAPYGFSFVASRRDYRKPTPNGWQYIHLALVQHPADFDVVVDAGVRFDLIQKQISGEADRRRHQATIGCEYGNLLGTGQHRWPVEAASDVTPAAQGILKACETTLFPFLERYSDLATVYEALKRDDQHAHLLMPLDHVRNAIITAAEGLLSSRQA
jgi:hypothetical protein